jgi:hypothetical protein
MIRRVLQNRRSRFAYFGQCIRPIAPRHDRGPRPEQRAQKNRDDGQNNQQLHQTESATRNPIHWRIIKQNAKCRKT